MATRRRRTTASTRSARRTRTPLEWLMGWLSGLWGELTDEQRRDLAGLLLIGAAALVAAAMLVPGASWLAGLHRVTLELVGMGWPLLVGGLAVGGVLLLHPTGGDGVQRIQGLAAALAGVTVLGLLSLVSAPAGGGIGQLLAERLSQGLGRGGAALVLVVALALAAVFTVGLRVGELALSLLAAARAGATRKRSKARQARPSAGRARSVVAAADRGTREEEPEELKGEQLGADAGRELEDSGDEEQLDDVEGEDLVDERAVPGARAVGDWRLPRLDLLAAPAPRSRRAEAETQRQVARIEAKLALQNIEAHVVGVDDGPSVTRYVLETGERVLVNQITARDRDLALALAASSIRIEAPIPGRSAIGIEVPKKERRLVVLRELIEVEVLSTDALLVALGADVAGAARLVDLRKAPHLLIGGATDQGKSVLMHALLASLLLGHSPATLKLVMIDPKRVELAAYAGLPHLACPVIQEMDQATAALGWAVAEMERRYKTLAAAGARNISTYNEKRAARGEAPMSFVVVVVDELADLMMVSRQQARAEKRAGCEVEDSIVRLGQLARAVGIHLVLATQRPSVDVVTGLIKANVPSRLAVTTASLVDSRTILDAAGAEKLTGRGDMLYSAVGGDPVRLQGPLVTEAEVDALVDHWHRQGRPDYVPGLVDVEQSEAEVAAARMSRNGGEAET
jgi:DNA segregation ATPase FtsK/SpoIIIE, S-DNA-T family